VPALLLPLLGDEEGLLRAVAEEREQLRAVVLLLPGRVLRGASRTLLF
jgi:hypothetical protein